MKRVFAVFALALILAAPAQAQTSKYVGTWLYGTGADAVKVLQLGIRDEHNIGWGSAIGKDYVPYLEVSKVNSSVCYVMIQGAWSDTTESRALFALGQCGALVPTTGYQEYHAILVIKKPGMGTNFAADAQRQPFRFRIERRFAP